MNIILKSLFLFLIIYLILSKSFKNSSKEGMINIYEYFFLNNYSLSKEKVDKDQILFSYNIFFLGYSFSFKYNIIEIKFGIKFYDKGENIIKPSDLNLYYDLHIFCYLQEEKTEIIIESLAKIKNNEYLYCIEYSKIKESIKFGIKIYKVFDNTKYIINYISIDKFINYNNLSNKNNNLFDYLLINKHYQEYLNKISKENKNIKKYRLKRRILLPPYCILKRDIANYKNQWFFVNIYNNYFCFCKGRNSLRRNIDQKCKYKLYLTIIDENKNLYKKNSVLISDFFKPNIEPVDGFPLFKEMIRQDIKAYYMTIDEKIYNDSYINKMYDKKKINEFPIILEKNINLPLFLR